MDKKAYETIDLLEVLNAVRQHILAIILTSNAIDSRTYKRNQAAIRRDAANA